MMNREQMEKHKDFMFKSLEFHAKYGGKFIPLNAVHKIICDSIEIMVKQCELYQAKGFGLGRVECEKTHRQKKNGPNPNTVRRKRLKKNKALRESSMEVFGTQGYRSKSHRAMLRDL